VCSYKGCWDLSEHNRSVEKHNAKQNASQHLSSVLTNTQVLYNSTADKFSISFIKYKSLRSFAHADGQL
jgi:hypothetical protein